VAKPSKEPGRYSSATRLCGASGTRYMSLRGKIGQFSDRFADENASMLAQVPDGPFPSVGSRRVLVPSESKETTCTRFLTVYSPVIHRRVQADAPERGPLIAAAGTRSSHSLSAR
jgi:hypothetical protein